MIKIEELRNVKHIKDIEGLEIKKYVSIREKKAMIDSILDVLVTEDENGMYTYDSMLLEVYKKVTAVSLYTNIKLLENDYENYDIMMGSGLLKEIEEYCEDDEWNSDVYDFYMLLDDRIKDKMRENNIDHAIAKGVQDVVKIIDNTMEHVNCMLDKGDPNKIAKYLSKGVEMIADKLPDMSQLDVLKEMKKKAN